MLDESWVGRRVVIRHSIAGRGGLNDVVGELADLDTHRARVITRTGPVEIARPAVTAARLVAPSTREILALERICARGWRAEHSIEIGGWLLRANRGFSHRGNTVLALTTPRPNLVTALARVAGWYAGFGLPVGISVPVPARQALATALDGLGWTVATDVLVMTAPVPAVQATLAASASAFAAIGTGVRLDSEPDEAWFACFHHPTGSDTDVVRELLGRHERVRFATIELDGRPVAIARGVVDDGWLGVSAVAVEQAYRRRGLARALLAALCEWAGSEHGVTHSYLQVERVNTAATVLYRGLAYEPHHVYRYYQAPATHTMGR